MSYELLESLPVAVFVADSAGTPVYANRRAVELLGRGAERIRPEALADVYNVYLAGTDEPYPVERLPLVRALAGESVSIDDAEIRRDDGAVRLEVWGNPILDDGRVAGAVVAFHDVTDTKRAETELRLTHELALAISGAATVDDALGIAVRRVGAHTGWSFGQAWLPDATGSYLECTPVWHCTERGFEEFRAASEERTFARGAGLPGAVWATRRPRWIEDVRADPTFARAPAARKSGLRAGLAVPVLAGDEAVAVLEFFLQRPGRVDAHALDIVSTVAAQLGSFVRRRQAEDALRRSERELRELDRVKNVFLHGVSHELRTPLGAMRGVSLLLARDLERAEPKLSVEQQRTLLHRLANTARTMNRLLDDLLDLDRLVLGILEPERTRIDVGEVVRRVVVESEAGAGRRVELDHRPHVMAVDESKVERIVENLVSNAAKYSPDDAPIWVRVRPEGEGVLIVVEDAGDGVPEPMRERIFEAFNRGDADPTAAPGLGIGLSLVRAFAELHGGRAWVEDRTGGGASFRVFLADAPGAEDVAAAGGRPA